jgi:hypothetical protein
MSTTAPSSREEGSTKVDSFSSFDEERWLDHAPARNGANGSSAAPRAVTENRTTHEPFALPDLLYRRYLRDWPREKRAQFVPKQEWIGRVDEVRAEDFTATLVTRAAPDEIEYAEIDLDEVTPADRVQLRPGSVFYWVIGYRDEPYGQRIGISTIIFRKMTAPPGHQLQHAEAGARRAVAFLADSDDTSATP